MPESGGGGGPTDQQEAPTTEAVTERSGLERVGMGLVNLEFDFLKAIMASNLVEWCPLPPGYMCPDEAC